jgi:hypothetical protein
VNAKRKVDGKSEKWKGMRYSAASLRVMCKWNQKIGNAIYKDLAALLYVPTDRQLRSSRGGADRAWRDDR